VARELLANVCKEKKKQEITDELYQEEQRSRWTKKSVRPALKKQCNIESFQEMVTLIISRLFQEFIIISKLLSYESNLFSKK